MDWKMRIIGISFRYFEGASMKMVILWRISILIVSCISPAAVKLIFLSWFSERGFVLWLF